MRHEHWSRRKLDYELARRWLYDAGCHHPHIGLLLDVIAGIGVF